MRYAAASSLFLLSVAFLTNGATSQSTVSNAVCTSAYYDIPIHTNITNFNIDALFPTTKNQSQTTQLFVQAALDMSSLSAAVLGQEPLSESFRIHGTLCRPRKQQQGKAQHALQFLVHGLGFDSSYWHFTGRGVAESDYSYVYAAASRGFSTFRYDRLGTGLSERPNDGINVVQAATEVAILLAFAKMAKTTTQLGAQKWGRTVIVGHSYGSAQAQALSRIAPPTLVDGLLLTGFSINTTGLPLYLLGANYLIASQKDPQRYGGGHSSSLDWLITGSQAGAQIPFLYSPSVSVAAQQLFLQSEQPVTLGAFFTLSSIIAPSPDFRGPVMVMMGAKE
jgi:pimeloyl-ACP methyl ester carboxylesterase